MDKFGLKIGNFVLETTRVLPVVLSIVVITISVLAFQLIESGALTKIGFQPNTVMIRGDSKLVAQIESIEKQINSINSTLDSASSEQLSKLGAEKIDKKLEEVSSDLKSLKEIIVESPEKALAIPLLRKEMDELQSKQIALAASTKDQIDRIYDFSKWFLGLMITLAIGLVTMGFVRKPKTDI